MFTLFELMHKQAPLAGFVPVTSARPLATKQSAKTNRVTIVMNVVQADWRTFADANLKTSGLG
jgi:hypothetical protein